MLKKTVKTAASIILSFAMICSSVSVQPNISSAAVKAKKITLNKTKLNLNVGDKAKIKVKKVMPKGAGKAVKYVSASKKIAKVNKKGVVTAVSEGKTKITVTAKSNKKAKKVVKVTVRDNEAQQQSQTQPQTQPQPLAPVNPPANNKTDTAAPTQYVTPLYTSPVNPATTDEPVLTQAPATEVPATDVPDTEAPATEAPVNDTLIISGQSDVEKVLEKAAADPDITKVKIVTEEAADIVLPEGDYSSVELIIDAPLADISNHALFKNITVNEIAEDTYREYANGNNIDVNCANGRIIVAETAFSAVNILKDSSKIKVVVDGQVSAINVDAKNSEVDISGSVQEMINVNVTRESEIRSSHILNVKTLVKITYVVYPGAEDSRFLVKNEELIPDVYGIGSVQVNIEITGDVITVVAEYRDDISGQQQEVLLEGSIIDEYENAVEGAMVYVVPYTNAFDEADVESNPYLKKAFTDETGTYRIESIHTGNYIMVVKEESMVTAVQYLVITSSYGNVFRNETLQLFPKVQDGRPGMIKGILSDSVNGNPIEGLTARLRRGRGNTTGDILAKTVSDLQGEYSFENVQPGYYTVEFVDLRIGEFEKKYITTSVNAVVRAGEIAVVSAALTEGVKNTQIRFVLKWGDETSGASADLDSHLLGPGAAGTERFHTYYENQEYYDYENRIMYADLDHDDIDYEGPETTTIYEPVSGIYDFYIHNYSERENYYSKMLAQSSAKVDVYQGDRLILTYYPPNRDGTVWHVCSYDSNTGVFTEKSEMYYEEYPENVGSDIVSRPSPLPTQTPPHMSPPSAPYELDLTDENVIVPQGSATVEMVEDGVKVSVSEQYSGMAFNIPEEVTEKNFDTVTVSYRDPYNTSTGFGCGLWRNPDDKDTETVVAWDGYFAAEDYYGDALHSSGDVVIRLPEDDSIAYYVRKCLFFFNDLDALANGPAEVVITKVVFSHSQYNDGNEPTARPTREPISTQSPAPEATPTRKPTPTPTPYVVNGYTVDLSTVDMSFEGVSGTTVAYNPETGCIESTMPGVSGFIIHSSKMENRDEYKYVEITYNLTSGGDVNIYAGRYDATAGQDGTGWSTEIKLNNYPMDEEYTLLLSAKDYLENEPLGAVKIMNFGSDTTSISISNITFFMDGDVSTPEDYISRSLEDEMITVDGVAAAEEGWSEAKLYRFNSKISATGSLENTDARATVRFMNDANNLYFFVDVKDSNIDKASSDNYQRDGIEILFDEDNCRKTGSNGADWTENPDGMHHRFTGLDKDSAEKTGLVGETDENVSGGYVGKNIVTEIKYALTDKGYSIEGRIPFASEKAAGDKISLDLIIQDCKDGVRLNELYLYPTKEEKGYWNNESADFGTVILG